MPLVAHRACCREAAAAEATCRRDGGGAARAARAGSGGGGSSSGAAGRARRPSTALPDPINTLPASPPAQLRAHCRGSIERRSPGAGLPPGAPPMCCRPPSPLLPLVGAPWRAVSCGAGARPAARRRPRRPEPLVSNQGLVRDRVVRRHAAFVALGVCHLGPCRSEALWARGVGPRHLPRSLHSTLHPLQALDSHDAPLHVRPSVARHSAAPGCLGSGHGDAERVAQAPLAAGGAAAAAGEPRGTSGLGQASYAPPPPRPPPPSVAPTTLQRPPRWRTPPTPRPAPPRAEAAKSPKAELRR